MVLNEEQWIKELREKRIAYGISQGRLAVASGITREYLNKIESGKMKPSKELLETLYKELARFNPEAPLTMLFDYVYLFHWLWNYFLSIFICSIWGDICDAIRIYCLWFDIYFGWSK